MHKYLVTVKIVKTWYETMEVAAGSEDEAELIAESREIEGTGEPIIDRYAHCDFQIDNDEDTVLEEEEPVQEKDAVSSEDIAKQPSKRSRSRSRRNRNRRKVVQKAAMQEMPEVSEAEPALTDEMIQPVEDKDAAGKDQQVPAEIPPEETNTEQTIEIREKPTSSRRQRGRRKEAPKPAMDESVEDAAISDFTEGEKEPMSQTEGGNVEGAEREESHPQIDVFNIVASSVPVVIEPEQSALPKPESTEVEAESTEEGESASEAKQPRKRGAASTRKRTARKVEPEESGATSAIEDSNADTAQTSTSSEPSGIAEEKPKRTRRSRKAAKPESEATMVVVDSNGQGVNPGESPEQNNESAEEPAEAPRPKRTRRRKVVDQEIESLTDKEAQSDE